MLTDDEQQLIRGILKGDENAQSLFYREYRKRLYPVCIHFLGSWDPEAEDVIQRTFLVAFEKLDSFEGRSSLYTWMAHICVNHCYERLRQRRKHLSTLEGDLDLLLAPRAEAVQAKAEESTRKERLLAALRKQMARLAEPCRTLLGLRDVDGQSYTEIGKRLKLPLGTVMSRLSRCRETLKRMLLEGSEA